MPDIPGTPARAVLDAYAGSTVYVDGHGEFSLDTLAPEAIAALRDVLDLHAPRRIYTECDCEPPHTYEDVEVGHALEVDDVGLVCEDGFMYPICRECCTDEDGHHQTEECANYHHHDRGERTSCPTVKLITDALEATDA